MRHALVRLSCSLLVVSVWSLGGAGHALAATRPGGPPRATSHIPAGDRPSKVGCCPVPTIILVKVYYNSPGRDDGSNASLNGEWFRIHNVNPHGLTLNDFSVTDRAGRTFTFHDVTIGSHGSIRIHTGKGTDTATDLYWGRSSYAWNNTTDTATLFHLGKWMQKCSYDDPHASFKDC